MYNDIKTLADELEKQAAGAVKTVKVVSIKGIDPALVQQAIDAISGNRRRRTARPVRHGRRNSGRRTSAAAAGGNFGAGRRRRQLWRSRFGGGN